MTMLEILLPVLIILIGLSLLKCPIYISILCSAIYLQIFVNHMSLTNVFTGFFEAMTKNALLAVPFFMVAGSLIAASSPGHPADQCMYRDPEEHPRRPAHRLRHCQCDFRRHLRFRSGRDRHLRQDRPQAPLGAPWREHVSGHHHLFRLPVHHHSAQHHHDHLRRSH